MAEAHPIRKTDHIEYTSWASMKRRCGDPENQDYHLYGGRGITVCDRWMKSFYDFMADMGPRPSRKHMLDRKNNDGNYEPGNCRWATPLQSGRNTRKNKRITFSGKTLCLSEWSEETGFSQDVIQARLSRGWSIEETLTLIPGSFSRHKTLPAGHKDKTKLGRPG